jgi:hypothetical protein
MGELSGWLNQLSTGAINKMGRASKKREADILSLSWPILSNKVPSQSAEALPREFVLLWTAYYNRASFFAYSKILNSQSYGHLPINARID